MITRRTVFQTVAATAATLSLPARSRAQTQIDPMIELALESAIPAANNLLAYRATKADLRAFRMAFKQVYVRSKQMGVRWELPAAMPSQTQLYEGLMAAGPAARNAGLLISGEILNAAATEISTRAAGLKERVLAFPKHDPDDLCAALLLALKFIEDKQPDTALMRDVPPLWRVQNADNPLCCAADWGAMYIGTVLVPITFLDPIVGVIVGTTIWSAAKIGGC